MDASRRFLSASSDSSRAFVESVTIPIGIALSIFSMPLLTSFNSASRTGKIELSCSCIFAAHSATKSITPSCWTIAIARSITIFSATSLRSARWWQPSARLCLPHLIIVFCTHMTFSAFAGHHGTAPPAKQLRSQKVLHIRFCTGWRMSVLCSPLVYAVE